MYLSHPLTNPTLPHVTSLTALTLGKLVLQFIVSNGLGSETHLSQDLLQSPDAADDAALKHIRHLADLEEGSTL